MSTVDQSLAVFGAGAYTQRAPAGPTTTAPTKPPPLALALIAAAAGYGLYRARRRRP